VNLPVQNGTSGQRRRPQISGSRVSRQINVSPQLRARRFKSETVRVCDPQSMQTASPLPHSAELRVWRRSPYQTSLISRCMRLRTLDETPLSRTRSGSNLTR
jgi:hypothetical protein